MLSGTAACVTPLLSHRASESGSRMVAPVPQTVAVQCNPILLLFIAFQLTFIGVS